MSEVKKNGSGAFPYRFDVVPLKNMKIGRYQRPLTTFVEKIEAEFNPALVGTLAVSERSKTHYAVIDGQTRAEGMRRIGLKEAPCVVYEGLTEAQEAELFALFQTQRRGMTSASRFIAQVIAGNEESMAINEVVEENGLRVAPNKETKDNAVPTIPAVAALEYVYRGARDAGAKQRGEEPELLGRTLATIKAAWPKLPDTARSAAMIRGLGYYLKRHANIDDERLIARLQRVTPSELAKRAESLREGYGMGGSSPKYMADAIEAQYRRSR